MRAACLALCLSLAAGGAFAQDPQFRNGTPIDYTKPFIADGILVRPPKAEDFSLPVEVIGREELLTSADPKVVELRQMMEKAKAEKAAPAAKPTQSQVKPSP